MRVWSVILFALGAIALGLGIVEIEAVLLVFGVVFARSTTDDETGYVLTADEVASDARRAATATVPVDTGDLITS